MQKSTLLVLFSVLCIAHAAHLEGWYNSEIFGYRPANRDSGSFFRRNNNNVVLFGGHTDVVALAYDDMIHFNDMFEFDVSTKTWSKIAYATADAPAPRALFCSAYDSQSDAFYVFGGVNFTETYSGFTFWNDGVWKFDFATLTWTNLVQPVIPYARGAPSCAVAGRSMYMFGGAVVVLDNGVQRITNNEMWKYSLDYNNWTLLIADSFQDCYADLSTCVKPLKRQQHSIFAVGDTNQIILLGGTSFLPSGDIFPLNDVWMYDIAGNSWEQLDNDGAPSDPIPNFQAMTFVDKGKGYVYAHGGDVKGDTPVTDVCVPEATCIFTIVPSDVLYQYNIKKQKWTVVDTDYKTPRLRKTHIAYTQTEDGPIIYCFGGHDFDGLHGYGAIRTQNLWALEI